MWPRIWKKVRTIVLRWRVVFRPRRWMKSWKAFSFSITIFSSTWVDVLTVAMG